MMWKEPSLRKVDSEVLKRLFELTDKYGLSADIVGKRLGLTAWTVRFYLRQRRLDTLPYVPSPDHC